MNWRDKHARAQSVRDRADRPYAMPKVKGAGGRTRKMHPYMRPRKGGGAAVPKGRNSIPTWGPRFDAGPFE